MARHDAQRRGAAKGQSNIQKPEVAWSAFLGGSLGALGLLVADIDGDGKNEVIRADGGGVTATRADGTEVWKQRILAATTLLDVADMNGDGQRELVIYDSLGARILDLATGKPLWEQPPHEMGRVGTVRMRDLDGDGLPDLIIGECRGCGGDKQQTGFVYSFAGGFAAPKRVTLTYPDTAVGPAAIPVNFVGKPGSQLLLPSLAAPFTVVDGASAATIAAAPDLGFTGGGYVPACVAADVDGSPAEEAICFYTIGGEPTPTPSDPSRVFALQLKPGANPSLDVLWSRSFAPNESISASGYELLADLDGDGAKETLVTGRNAAGAHTIHILAASTGQEIGSVPASSFAGITPKLPNGEQLFLGVADGTGTPTLYRFAQGSVTSLGVLDGSPAYTVDRSRFAVSSANPYPLVALDVDSNGLPELFTIDPMTGDLRAKTVTSTSITTLGSIPFAADRPISGVWALPPIDRPYPQLGLALADGTLHFVDKTFALTSTSIRFGGFYASGAYRQLGQSPIVASLDGGPAQQILVRDSRRVLMRLDASAAKPTSPPVKVWEQLGVYSPIVAPSSAGPVVFTLHVDAKVSPPAYTVRRLHADGSIMWEVPVSQYPPNDIVAGDFDGDGVADVLLQSGAVNAAAQTTAALSGVDGHVLWSNTFTGCNLHDGASVVDWNGDGIDDVVQQSSGTQVFSGADGSLLAQGGSPLCYALPVAADLMGDGTADVVITGTNGNVAAYSTDLAMSLYTSPDADQPYPYGAVATCPDGPVLAEGSWTYPSRLKITTLGGPNLGATKDLFLVGGTLYTDQATADAHGNSQLTAANVHENLTGDGRPAVLVGSGDGWLYAVDPCAGALTFDYDFGAAVGEPVFGDTDGDGLDEIVVSVADGYLYGLKNESPVVGGGGMGGSTSSSSTSSSSGMGGFGGAGGSGAGGTGGAGTTTGAGGQSGGTYPLTGRAGLGCYCGLGEGAPDANAPLAFAAALLVSAARRRRRS